MNNSLFKQTFGGDARRREIVNDIANELSHMVMVHLDRCTKTCVNCGHWRQGPPTKPMEVCGLVNKRPPAKVIAFGCEHYEDSIPF